MSDSICPVCKIEPPKATEFATPIYSPGVRHDANNLECKAVPRLSPERAEKLKKKLKELDDARFEAMKNSHNIWIR